jgi:hypothetical protein
MSYFVCFALTPRAGPRNHIFLVPRNDSATKERVNALAPQIQELVSQANRPSGSALQEGWAVVWHQVRQRSTGRLAYEWVAAAWEPAVPLPENVTSDLLSMLSGLLTQLTQAVEKARWDRGSELFELWPELATWQKDFAQKVSPVLLSLAGSLSGLACAPAWKMARFSLLVGLCVGSLLIVLPGVLCDRNRLKLAPETTDTTPPVPRGAPMRILNSKPTPDWGQLADAVGIKCSIGCERWVAKKIFERCKQLFAFEEKDSQGVEHRSQISQPDSFEERLCNLLALVEQELGRQPAKDLSVLANSPHLHSQLRRLFPQGTFDPFGLVRGDRDWDAAAEFFHGYDRHQLARWVESVQRKRPSDGWRVPQEVRNDFGRRYNDLYQTLDWLEEVNSCPLAHSGLSPEPRFYLWRDRWVIDIYRAFGETVGHTLNESQSFTQWRRRLPERVNSALRSLEAEGEAADTARRVWQDRLEALLAVLQE